MELQPDRDDGVPCEKIQKYYVDKIDTEMGSKI